MASELREKYKDLVRLSSESELVARSLKSLLWFKRQVNQIIGYEEAPHRAFMGNAAKEMPSIPIPGNIVAFKYDPVGKDTLPYYDVFPLVLVLKLTPTGFLGINFHHLYPIDRAYFMTFLRLYESSQGANMVRINIEYETLKNSTRPAFYKTSIRRYRNTAVKSVVYTLTHDEWEVALFLPTEGFVKEDKRAVWAANRQIIRRLKPKSPKKAGYVKRRKN